MEKWSCRYTVRAGKEFGGHLRLWLGWDHVEMPNSGGGVERVRASVELTRAERTAELRFLPSVLDSGRSLETMLGERSPLLAEGFRVLQGAHRIVRSHLNVSDIPGPAGRIDFVQDRALYRGGGGWLLTAPGWDCIGEPGEWEADALDDDTLGDNEPSWLLELIAAATTATDAGSDMVRGTPCRRYGTVASLALAREQASRPMGPRRTRDHLNPEGLPIDVWLDEASRVRRAVLLDDRTLMKLELCDFGGPDSIDLPTPDEILPPDG